MQEIDNAHLAYIYYLCIYMHTYTQGIKSN